MMKKPELLAPAGNLEKLKIAIHYGADAVYLAGEKYGLRAFAGNFSENDLRIGVAYAHAHQVKVYVALNNFPHNQDLSTLSDYIMLLKEAEIDAFIIADPGVFRIAKMTAPEVPIHISTQANTVNWSDALFWQEQGAERVVLARELTLPEISTIKNTSALEIECFIHGAMCISYSGRCLLSNYMANRDANLGECAQPCRWNYALVEEKRPNTYYAIEEDEQGTYVFNSQDLCLLNHMAELIKSGIDSFKIEGRMKSIYYLATTLRAYRAVLDGLWAEEEVDLDFWQEELEKISHRPYTTGFYFGKPEDGGRSLTSAGYIKPYDFIGIVESFDPATNIAIVEQRNKFGLGDTVEFIGPDYQVMRYTIEEMMDENGRSIDTAPHAQQKVQLQIPFSVYPYDLLRKPTES